MATGVAAKRLEFLREAVPGIARVLVVSYLADPSAAPQLKELEGAAGSLGVKLLVQDIRTADDLPAAFAAGATDGAEGILTTAESIFVLSASAWSNSGHNTDCRACTLTGEWSKLVA